MYSLYNVIYNYYKYNIYCKYYIYSIGYIDNIHYLYSVGKPNIKYNF